MTISCAAGKLAVVSPGERAPASARAQPRNPPSSRPARHPPQDCCSNSPAITSPPLPPGVAAELLLRLIYSQTF